MLSIKENITSTYIIKKSKFINYLYKIDTTEEINEYINNLKKQYKDATHICYAYILDKIERFSDDNEPNGTAGMPLLNVLKNNNLNHILCCTVRYFGGIKLGAGGLVRAYTNSCTQTLKNTTIINIIKGYTYEITFDYENTKTIDNILKNTTPEKKYDEKITYTIKTNNENIINEIKKYAEVKKIKECYIEENH